MKRLAVKRILFVTCAAIFLAACGKEMPKGPSDRLILHSQSAVMIYSFYGETCGIDESERSPIHAFLRNHVPNAQDILVVSVPAGKSPRQDADRIKALQNIFVGYPFATRYFKKVDFHQATRSDTSGVIRLVRPSALGSNCGQLRLKSAAHRPKIWRK